MGKSSEKVCFVPVLDSGFQPAAIWHRQFDKRVAASGEGVPVTVAVCRPNGTRYARDFHVLPETAENRRLNLTAVERVVKFLLWQKGGSRIAVSGSEWLLNSIRHIYSPDGVRAFDAQLMGEKVFGEPFSVTGGVSDAGGSDTEKSLSLGGHLDGCRIGFDLGGSDRKCAALIDGEVVFSEEIPWSPYFEKEIGYHYDGIMDSLRRAAAHLPRVDAIGGSAAGVYIGNRVRIASLFRGIPEPRFRTDVEGLFLRIAREWEVPFEVVNDGEVTALAGTMASGRGALLGIAMGTSEAAGYCDASGNITPWLNELAFAPVDYRENGPLDEWSGDRGCGVQYFSQQAVGRLLPASGLSISDDMPLAERLVLVQDRMAAGDLRAADIFSTLGTYLGYTVAHYASFYDLRQLMLLGRVMSGEGGQIIIAQAEEVLRAEFPCLAEEVRLCVPDEKTRRHGQAVAAASLPVI